MKKRTILVLSVLALFVLGFVSACGPKAVEISTTMKEFTFDPNSFTVPKGAKVTLKLNNMGALQHEFVIMNLGKQATIPFDDDDEGNIYWEQELDPGENMSVEFTAPSDPGEYQVVCGTPGHLEQGMMAKLIVK